MSDDNLSLFVPKRNPLLIERQKTHGSFADNAKYSQSLKAILDIGREHRSHIHNEALEMIALKLSRILSGQANFKDHWLDLSGYSLLAMEACKNEQH